MDGRMWTDMMDMNILNESIWMAEGWTWMDGRMKGWMDDLDGRYARTHGHDAHVHGLTNPNPTDENGTDLHPRKKHFILCVM